MSDDMVKELREHDFPFEEGPVRGCHICMRNKPTRQTKTVKASSGEWITICDECERKGA